MKKQQEIFRKIAVVEREWRQVPRGETATRCCSRCLGRRSVLVKRRRGGFQVSPSLRPVMATVVALALLSCGRNSRTCVGGFSNPAAFITGFGSSGKSRSITASSGSGTGEQFHASVARTSAAKATVAVAAAAAAAAVASASASLPSAQLLEPQTTPSDEKRRRSAKAMMMMRRRDKVDRVVLDGVDATILELLSDDFLYAPQQQQSPSSSSSDRASRRPKGRPEYVPGAMKFETMLKYREQQANEAAAAMAKIKQQQERVSDAEMAVIAPYVASPLSSSSAAAATTTSTVTKNGQSAASTSTSRKRAPTTTTSEKVARGRHGSKGSSNLKGSDAALLERASLETAAASTLNSLPVTKTEPKPRKRRQVVKNLPKPKDRSRSTSSVNMYTKRKRGGGGGASAASRKVNGGGGGMNSGTSGGNGHADLHRYYATELLTADEEYSLGMKVQFMMKCEQVHEGLAAHLMRLPTVPEWAAACGFVDAPADVADEYVPCEGDEQLRPAGSESMFEVTDPNMFVGNGPAHTAGPGRGRGRVKRPPPLQLEDFYDDSEIKRQMRNSKKANKRSSKSTSNDDQQQQVITRVEDLRPLNRGTVTDFVELLMTCREAKQRMVQSNMRLVLSIARKYANLGVSLQDLVQEGSLGLSRAAEKFEPQKGFKFSTYASWWIQQAVFRSIAYHSRTIRLPVHVHNLLNRVRKVRNTLQRDLGRLPTNEEMAQHLGMPLVKYNKMLRLTRRSISLETPKYQSNPKDLGHESVDMLGDGIADAENGNVPESKVDRGLFYQDLMGMLEILEVDERAVICARYGLEDGLTKTVTAVAHQLKQSKAWVRSQECRALRKLRRPWYEKKLKEHQDTFMN